MPAKTVKLKDLRSATEASVAAVLGRKLPVRPGILVGLWIDPTTLRKLELTPTAVARNVARQVSLSSGIKVLPGVRKAGGGVLVGYIQPKISKR